ncbi:hypothetical protein ACFRFJ_09105 [Streptomyces hydrogenans]|uniref:hypothetical protein n=1 Tax=Streptomyces hydrogenans TaxID=1873719 RepID=UPI0036A4CF8C
MAGLFGGNSPHRCGPTRCGWCGQRCAPGAECTACARARAASHRLLVSSAAAVFVDDKPGNVTGAGAVGITAVRFTDAGALRTALEDLPGR